MKKMLACSIAEDVGGFCRGNGEAARGGPFSKEERKTFIRASYWWSCEVGRAYGFRTYKPVYVVPDDLDKESEMSICVSLDVSDHASIFSIAVAPFRAKFCRGGLNERI